MSEIPASYSILPKFIENALAGNLLETHRLALRSLDLLAELRKRVDEIKWFGAKNLSAQEGSRRRFLAATLELHEIWDTYTTVEVYEPVALALINASCSKESIKYEDNLGECFHELVLRMVGMNLNALFMLPFPLHWKSDEKQLMGWLAVDASRQFESAKFRFGVGDKDGWWLHAELRREVIGAAKLICSQQASETGFLGIKLNYNCTAQRVVDGVTRTVDFDRQLGAWKLFVTLATAGGQMAKDELLNQLRMAEKSDEALRQHKEKANALLEDNLRVTIESGQIWRLVEYKS